MTPEFSVSVGEGVHVCMRERGGEGKEGDTKERREREGRRGFHFMSIFIIHC